MKNVAPFNLSADTLGGIARFVAHADTLFALLEALRTTHDLGVLENLWQLLKQHNWSRNDLWPRLSLLSVDIPSPVHLEAIVNYYAEVAVSETTDVEWVRTHFSPQTRLCWIRRPDTHFIPTSHLIQLLSFLPHLEVIDWYQCPPDIAPAVFHEAWRAQSCGKRIWIISARSSQQAIPERNRRSKRVSAFGQSGNNCCKIVH
ncbi:hypothetical protein AC1031_011406 [Aphanomyces cochlioides]|nr:hypothetical protein AC1031_011406 [Aphanomyces cochlioides]